MIRFIILLIGLFGPNCSNAQFENILQRAKQKTKSKVEQKVDQKMDKVIDKTLDDVEGGGKNKNSSTPDKSGEKKVVESDPDDSKKAVSNAAALQSYSKFDFVPGEKLVAAEDFSQDAIGDFPARWNTNGSGEIVTTNKTPGKFLMTQKETIFYPDWISDLPDNFTLEFDLMSTDAFNFYSGFFVVGFTSATNIGKDFKSFARFGEGRISDGGGFEVGFHPNAAGGQTGMTEFYASFNHEEIVRNNADQDKLSEPEKTKTHISIWRQKSRVRVYMDEKKLWDMPRAIANNLQLNSLYFRNNAADNNEDAYYIANIRLAVGNPDTRNKLINEGKFISHGILFDLNSDQIKPESYGAIKEIATILMENTSVNVLIVGHTDSDGNDEANMKLSLKRATAVKNFLQKEFMIDSNRLTTDGKGESLPIETNSSAEGKANNRRVEFIKQ